MVVLSWPLLMNILALGYVVGMLTGLWAAGMVDG